MRSKEEFKSFVRKHDEFINEVKDKRHTWQDLYELYDIYGDDENAWNKYLKTSNNINTNSLKELTSVFKNVDIDNVRKYIDTAEKAIGIIEGLIGTKGPSNIINPILASSLGCSPNPPRPNQLLDPFLTLPIPGIKTSISNKRNNN